MLELISNYSISEILIFFIIFAIGVKSLVSFIDWAIERIKKIFNKENDKKDEIEDIQERLERSNQNFNTLSENQNELKNKLLEITNKIELLIESDKDDIKSYITKEHHYFCYNLQWIDDYNLDCIEKRYAHYKEEGGNSFIKELMEEIRALPKHPQEE